MNKKESIVFVTKDAMCKGYLPVYGNQYWKGKTPNIDELASKGTIFNNYYTAAASTVMSFRSMVFGKNPYETPYSNYIPQVGESIDPISENDFFYYGKKLGYKTHLIWDSSWTKGIKRYGNYFGDSVEIHTTEGVNQPVGPHVNNITELKNNDEELHRTAEKIRGFIDEIAKEDGKVLLWIHFPHVIKGRISYGGDIDAFDLMVGIVREYFEDNNIFISADHGNMDGFHGLFSYAFDLYTPEVEIPLITPRINGLPYCNDYFSNINIKQLIYHRIIPKTEYVLSDTAYFAQPHRKLLIIKNEFAYIFSKKGKKEELYDLRYDRYERCNLLNSIFIDKDRGLQMKVREVYFSPRWDEVSDQIIEFRKIKESIWKEPNIVEKIKGTLLMEMKKLYHIFHKFSLFR